MSNPLPILRRSLRLFALGATIAVLLSPVFGEAWAQSATRAPSAPGLSAGFRFTEQSGEALYANSCQACHMPDAKGAVGAGAYPALAGDKNLGAREYAVSIVVNGQRGMPPIGAMMSDDQVAAVVNYVRRHFGNNYQDPVTVEDVKIMRR